MFESMFSSETKRYQVVLSSDITENEVNVLCRNYLCF